MHDGTFIRFLLRCHVNNLNNPPGAPVTKTDKYPAFKDVTPGPDLVLEICQKLFAFPHWCKRGFPTRTDSFIGRECCILILIYKGVFYLHLRNRRIMHT